MNTEKQATEMIDAYTQMNQLIWNSWADTLQGWSETFGHAANVWGEAFRTATESQLAIAEDVGKQMEKMVARERKAA